MIFDFGWSNALQHSYDTHAPDGTVPARVIAQHRGRWDLMTEDGEVSGTMAGHYAHTAASGSFPVTGDWVACDPPVQGTTLIRSLLPRSTVFVRRAAGGVGEQVVVANVDTALLVCALNGDLNPRRLERFLIATRDSGAAPVVVLTKADLATDREAAADAMRAVAGDAPLVMLSARSGEGLDQLDPWLRPGQTLALLGSSGAGKSTLVNALIGAEVMATKAVREADDRGRHTTTTRQMLRLPGGALIIDTPGMRELGLVSDEEAFGSSFADVVALSRSCRFGDCRHDGEPGCAIGAALADGTLADGRWNAFLKLQREIAFNERRGIPAAEAAERAKWRKIHKSNRARYRFKEQDREW